ncbi:type II secretory pathway, component PulF [Opitutaceae bacterium TAV1]|nr:type II secretory pathway, component PulF [Opitutaceae bacterium TAV1]
MPAYIVRYTNEKGQVRKERLYAPDMAYLQGLLQRKRCWPLSIKVEERKTRTWRTKLGLADIISILDQVEIQLEVNINIDDAFRNLVDEFPRGKPKFVVANISDEINSSGRVADACAQFPRIFPDHIRQMISVGESTGKLAQAFRRLINYFQGADALRATIISASMYPAMVVVAMVAFIFVIFGFTVPTLMAVFIEIGVELPWFTLQLVAFSDFIRANMILLLTVTALSPFIIGWSFRSKFTRPVIDWCMAKAMVIGPITRDVCISRFAANLGALYESEIPIVQGLSICSRIAGNYLYNKGLQVVKKSVEEGQSIADGLKLAKIFPSMVVLTIRVGEDNGKLDDSLRKLADYHNRKAKEKVERALKLFEPVMLIVLVVMVGVLAYALLMPMVTMIEQMSKMK